MGRLRYADQIGQNFPKSWAEGGEYTTGGSLAIGDLVGVVRSDGSVKFGQIVGKAGFIGNNWEVWVCMLRVACYAARAHVMRLYAADFAAVARGLIH